MQAVQAAAELQWAQEWLERAEVPHPETRAEDAGAAPRPSPEAVKLAEEAAAELRRAQEWPDRDDEGSGPPRGGRS